MGFVTRFCCGLRVRLALLVLLVCAPLVALTVHQASEEKRRLSNGLEQRAARLSQTAAKEETALLRDTRQLLLSIGTLSGVQNGNWESVRHILEEELSRRPQYLHLGILDPQGRLLVSGTPMFRTNFSSAVFFKRTIATAAFSGGRASVRYVAQKAAMDFGHPVYGPKGLIGVAFATLDLDWLDKFQSRIRSQLQKDAVWTEIDPSGKIVWRHPNPDGLVGRPIPEAQLPKQLRESIPNDAQTWTASSGVEMVTAFASRNSELTGGPVIGVLTVPEDVLFQNVNQILTRNFTWLAAAIALALLLGWIGSHFLIVKPIRTMARTSIRLAAGDLTVRTGLKHSNDELGQLTLAFDQMAEALEHREQERLQSAKKLQVLSHKLVEVQENERRHIARELHDEIGQSLTAAEMNLQAALQAPRAPNIERRLTASMQAVEHVLEQVHDLSLNLRPSMLDDLGLEPALRWLTRRQSELAGVDAEFHSDRLDKRLHPVVETECFRIAQEALTNIVRHAGAQRIWVSLTRNDDHLHLRVRDDGQGFDVGRLRGDAVMGASLGLLSMEERAALAGGGISLHSSKGKGTEVHAWFPLRWEHDQLPAVDPQEKQANLKVI